MKTIIVILSFLSISSNVFAQVWSDPCGAPMKVDYVKMVSAAGLKGCGQATADFNTTKEHGTITGFSIPQDSNLYYSILVQDPATGKSLDGVVKCDVTAGTASLLTLQFVATSSYGGCSTLP